MTLVSSVTRLRVAIAAAIRPRKATAAMMISISRATVGTGYANNIRTAPPKITSTTDRL